VIGGDDVGVAGSFAGGDGGGGQKDSRRPESGGGLGSLFALFGFGVPALRAGYQGSGVDVDDAGAGAARDSASSFGQSGCRRSVVASETGLSPSLVPLGSLRFPLSVLNNASVAAHDDQEGLSP